MTPHPTLTALEARSAYEAGATLTLGKTVATWWPRGRRRVLVLPGFLAGDASTLLMRRTLGQLGHEVHRWRLGINLGPTPALIERLVARIEELTDDAQPLDLIGWSLGGIFALEIAREVPERVGVVVTLGTPIQASGPKNSHAHLPFSMLEPFHEPSVRAQIPSVHRPPIPVPTTSIYSRSDGIVRWQDCLAVPSAGVENVEVVASHIGMGANLAALYVVADRLAAAESGWQPFSPPRWLRSVYPAPRAYRVAGAA
ncbi:MAG: thioesterase domain-containing protein [Actinomycetota bacterium]